MKKYFKQFPNIAAVFSEKNEGSMKLFDRDWSLDGKTDENRKNLFKKIGIDLNAVVYAYLKNSNQVKIIEDTQLRIVEETDGLVTRQKDLYLAITAADCIPVYFYDSDRKIIGLAHAGWRGTVGDIIKNTIEKMKFLESKAEDIFVQLGPGINECHFEIKEDILDKFSQYPEFILRKDEKIYIDIKGIIKRQLLAEGIRKENIENDPDCTYCSKNLFSSRRDKTDPLKAMIAVIGIR